MREVWRSRCGRPKSDGVRHMPCLNPGQINIAPFAGSTAHHALEFPRLMREKIIHVRGGTDLKSLDVLLIVHF